MFILGKKIKVDQITATVETNQSWFNLAIVSNLVDTWLETLDKNIGRL